MLIRPATPNDASAIAVIHVGTWQAAYRGMIPEAILDALSADGRADFWHGLLSAEHRTMVAESNAEVIGFCSLIPAREGETGVAEIAALYVIPAHWRQGAGGALCAAVFKAAIEDGFSTITLWVLAANERAISFYQAQGFARDGTVRTEELSDGSLIPEVRLRRRLP